MSTHTRHTPGAPELDRALVDRLIELYCGWREECEAVRRAYTHVWSSPAHDRVLASAGYEAALDREAAAAATYAAQIAAVSTLLGTGATRPRVMR